MANALPKELSYLRGPARQFGPAHRYWAGAGRVERDGEAWRLLAGTHHALHQQEDAIIVAHWLTQPVDEGARREERGQVRGLLRLLRRLGTAGVKPFDEPVLRLPRMKKAAPTADQGAPSAAAIGRLPTRLRYLIGRAQRLGIRPRWHRLAEFIDAVNERRFNALVATADRMRRRGDDRLLRRWLGGQPNADTRETALARGLLHVFDALEIF